MEIVHSIGGLARDLRTMRRQATRQLPRVVAKNARNGNAIAKRFARVSSGAHGRLYPRAFRPDRITPLEWEYGPSREYGKQGDMSFEGGSRNQPPHRDLARSAELVGPQLAADAGDMLDGLFWP